MPLFYANHMRDITEEVRKALDEEDALREEAYRLHREAIRSAREAIQRVHEGGEVGEELLFQREKLLRMVEENPFMHRYTFIEDALSEVAEALIFERVMKEGRVPSPGEVGVPPRPYLLGLCDVVGELRRVVVKRLIEVDLPGARRGLDRMEEIWGMIDGLVYPSALIPIKRKQDVVRSLLDRTEGEYLVALSRHGNP